MKLLKGIKKTAFFFNRMIILIDEIANNLHINTIRIILNLKYQNTCIYLQLLPPSVHVKLRHLTGDNSAVKYTRGCQIGMQRPHLCAKPRHFFKLDVANSRMVFLDLNLHFLQLVTSNSNN